MTYVIGRIGTSIGSEFKTRYTRLRCIEADTEEAALNIYNKPTSVNSHFYNRCIGVMNQNSQLLISNFSKKYRSSKEMKPTAPGTYNFIVSKLLEEPDKLSEFSLYVPAIIQAKNADEALSIYNQTYAPSRFKAYVLGYLDENDNFIVPNILDYIAK